MELVLWVEAHPGLASWVQAVGAIVALGIAVFMPVLHERSKERRSLKQAQKLLAYMAHRQYELLLMLYVPLNESIIDWGEKLQEYEDSGLAGEWVTHRAALDQISIQDFTAKAINDVVHLKSAADFAVKLTGNIDAWNPLDDSNSSELKTMKRYMDRAKRIYTGTGIISDTEI